jgi:ABC-type tungstate transport system substrate-binding protein
MFYEGALQAPLIGIFVLSSIFSFVNTIGLFAGAISGFAIGAWLALGSFIVKPKYPKLNTTTLNCTTVNEGLALVDLIARSSKLGRIFFFLDFSRLIVLYDY